MDLKVNYPKSLSNKQSFGKVIFKDGTASEIGVQAARLYGKKKMNGSMYNMILEAMDSFVLRQSKNEEVNIIVSKKKNFFGKERIVAEVKPLIDVLETKVFKQKSPVQKGSLVDFLFKAEDYAKEQSRLVKDLRKMNYPKLS